ncbi:MAG: helix-turn-helix domain-containing protein [Alphaproteobacteria bacterium]
MTTYLQQQLKERMEAKKLTIYALEKKAGLNRSAVRNILQGFSRNPSIEILHAITKILECNIDDLIEKKESIQDTIHINMNNDKIYNENIWNEKLYIEAVKTVSKFVEGKDVTFDFKQMTNLINESYQYSAFKNSNQIDQDFCKWIIYKSTKN